MVYLKVLIDNKELKLFEANTFFKRLIGLCFKRNINYALRFRCNGIHTFFMFENIDVILTDKNNNILYYYKNFGKNKVLLPKKNVFYTYELPKNTIKNKPKKITVN